MLGLPAHPLPWAHFTAPQYSRCCAALLRSLELAKADRQAAPYRQMLARLL